MWWLGLALHRTSFGFLSVFMPLYIVSIGGSLIDIGLMSSLAISVSIPANLFWGYACDRTRSYRSFIALSFIPIALTLYLISLADNVKLLIALYTVMAVFDAAHESPKNVLIAESYLREEWRRGFALYEGLTKIGWLLGLVLGFFASSYNLIPSHTLIMCSILNVAAFIASTLSITNPIIVIERKVLAIRRSMDVVCQGLNSILNSLDGLRMRVKLEVGNLTMLCAGITLFFTALSVILTPLPIFLSRQLSLPRSTIFALHALCTFSEVASYFTVMKLQQVSEKRVLTIVAILGSLIALILALTVITNSLSIVMLALVLLVIGIVNSLFPLFSLILSMELTAEGRAGLFNALTCAGSACGAFIGPFLAERLGFISVFLVSSLIFLLAYTVLNLS